MMSIPLACCVSLCKSTQKQVCIVQVVMLELLFSLCWFFFLLCLVLLFVFLLVLVLSRYLILPSLLFSPAEGCCHTFVVLPLLSLPPASASQPSRACSLCKLALLLTTFSWSGFRAIPDHKFQQMLKKKRNSCPTKYVYSNSIFFILPHRQQTFQNLEVWTLTYARTCAHVCKTALAELWLQGEPMVPPRSGPSVSPEQLLTLCVDSDRQWRFKTTIILISAAKNRAIATWWNEDHNFAIVFIGASTNRRTWQISYISVGVSNF